MTDNTYTLTLTVTERQDAVIQYALETLGWDATLGYDTGATDDDVAAARQAVEAARKSFHDPDDPDPLDTLRAFVAALDADDYIGNGAYKNRKIAERVRVMLDSLPAGADPSENAFDYYMTRSREMRAEAANAWLVGENARLTNELRELHNRVAAMLDSAGED